jgi:hypothetical protein
MLDSDASTHVPALDAKGANCITPRGRRDRFIENRGIESTNGKIAKATINMHGSFKVIQPPSMEQASANTGQKMVSTLRAGNINSLLASPGRSSIPSNKLL